MRKLLLLLAGWLAVSAAHAQVTPWGPAIQSALPAMTGPAAFAAANLSQMDFANPYTVKVISPLTGLLEARGVTSDLFAKMPKAKRVALVREALEAKVQDANKRAAKILYEHAEQTAAPGRKIENAAAAEDLLLFSHPYLEPQRRAWLAESHGSIQAEAAAVRRERVVGKAAREARGLGATMEEGSAAPAPGGDGDPQASDGTPGQAVAAPARELLEAIARQAVYFIGADPRLSDDEKDERLERWQEAVALLAQVEAGQASNDRGWVSEFQALLAPLTDEFGRHLTDAWTEVVSRGKRADPAQGWDDLKKLDVLLSKASPLNASRRHLAGAAEGASREDLTAAVFALLMELKPVAMDYIMEDGQLSADRRWTRTSAWQSAADAFVGYPKREGSSEMSAEAAAKALKAVKPRLKELKAYLLADPLLYEDAAARGALLSEAGSLAGHLKRLSR